jgi:bifunctional DNA-binding transcriptional regulator/antitoxin component of YhaV-PrlF toxin-antitoxin module
MPAVKTKEHQPNEVLSLRDNAKTQLELIRTVQDGITYLNKLKSIEVWIQAEKKDAELQNLIAEQKLRTQRILGELIKENQRKGFLANKVNNLKAGPDLPEGNIGKDTIPGLGISYKQSATFQTIADIPQDKFEEYIAEKKEQQKQITEELTTAGALRFAKSLQEHQPPEPQETILVETDADKQVKEMADYINQHFTKEQKAALIVMIYPN